MAVATQKITVWSILGFLIIPAAMIGNASWQFAGGPGIGIGGWWLLIVFEAVLLICAPRPSSLEVKQPPEDVECLNCGQKLAGSQSQCSSCGWSWESDANESA